MTSGRLALRYARVSDPHKWGYVCCVSPFPYDPGVYPVPLVCCVRTKHSMPLLQVRENTAEREKQGAFFQVLSFAIHGSPRDKKVLIREDTEGFGTRR